MKLSRVAFLFGSLQHASKANGENLRGDRKLDTSDASVFDVDINVDIIEVEVAPTSSSNEASIQSSGYDFFDDASQVEPPAETIIVEASVFDVVFDVDIIDVEVAPSDNESSIQSSGYQPDDPKDPECPEGEHEFVFSLKTDNYGDETSWDITDSSGNELGSGGNYGSVYASDSEITPWKKCLPDGESYIFTIYDSYGDGICCSYGQGFYKISVAGNVLIEGGEFGESEIVRYGSPSPSTAASPSPTKVPTATPTLSPSKAPTLSPSKAPTPPPTKDSRPTQSSGADPGCPEREHEVILSLKTDNYGDETSWGITDSSGNELGSGGNYGNNSEITWKKCFPDGEIYIFTIYDSYGDGICCSYGQGFYEISVAGHVSIEGGEFGTSERETYGYSA